jgi:hypothetical protein
MVPAGLVFPADFGSLTRYAHTGVNAAAWFEQPIGERVSLIYLGGVSFSRESRDLSLIVTPRLPLQAPIVQRTDVIAYNTAAVVGFEARIGLTEHVRLLPGVRLQGLSGGWLLRPGVGLGWRF